MKGNAKWISGFGAGAALAYLLDPEAGGRRRARFRERLGHLGRSAGHFVALGSRDLVNRVRGLLAVGMYAVRGESDLTDDVIEDRVRSKLGRVVSHPHAVHVASDDGRVTLRGLILAREMDSLISEVQKTHGVKSVDNQLEAHKHSDRISSLQGGRPRRHIRFDLLQTNWAPATRLLIGAAGSALVAGGARRRDAAGAIAAGVGLIGLVRSVTNLEIRRLLGLTGRNAISFHKTVNIGAPVERVYEFWSNPRNFPRFMKEVREARVTGGGRSHWTVQGPLNAPVSWEAEISRDIPNRVFAWRSIPGSLVQNAGQVKFFPGEKGGTKLEIDFSYNPPSGALAHTLAKLFGSDPKARLDECMMEMKQLIEQGPSRRQARVLGE